MARKILSDEQKKLNEVKHLYQKQQNKKFNYSVDNFDIDHLHENSIQFKWKHKSWNVWMKGGTGITETKNIVTRYIEECNKPYGKRNFSQFHSVSC